MIEFKDNLIYCKDQEASDLIAQAVMKETSNLDDKAIAFVLQWYPEMIIQNVGFSGYAINPEINLIQVTDDDEIAEIRLECPDAIAVDNDVAYEGVLVWDQY